MSGNGRVIAITGRQGLYRCVCVTMCVFLHPGSFYNLDLIFFIWPSFLYDSILFTISFYRQRDAMLLDGFMSQTMGHRKQKPSDNNKLLLARTGLCETFCSKL